MRMYVEWDPKKARSNLKKHGVDFADAAIALEDPNALTIEDAGHHELRFRTLGMGPNLNILLIVHVYRGEDAIRIISARKADRGETAQYHQGLSYE